MNDERFDYQDLIMELIKSTQSMRDLQKEYFKTRSTGILIKPKDAELKVDNLLYALQNPGVLNNEKNTIH